MSWSLLYLVTALAAAVMAGFFFSFSVVVMDGLKLLPPLDAMRAMQSINLVVRNPLFGLAFFGTPILCVLAVLTLTVPAGRDPGGLIAAIGAVTYLALVLVVTIAKNVPMNEVLADALDPARWADFVEPWIFWNHVRTLGSLAAACLLAAGYALRVTR